MVYEPPDGATVLRLRVPESAVPFLAGTLTGPTGPAAGTATRPPHEMFHLSARRALRAPRPAALALTAALLLGLFGLHTFVLGKHVTAEVTAKSDGVCSVRWQDPRNGGTRTAGVDCYGGEQAKRSAADIRPAVARARGGRRPRGLAVHADARPGSDRHGRSRRHRRRLAR